MRLSINVDSIDTADFRRFLAHMSTHLGHAERNIPVTARCNGPEKWAGESDKIHFDTAADAADFLRALADRWHVEFPDAPIVEQTGGPRITVEELNQGTPDDDPHWHVGNFEVKRDGQVLAHLQVTPDDMMVFPQGTNVFINDRREEGKAVQVGPGHDGEYVIHVDDYRQPSVEPIAAGGQFASMLKVEESLDRLLVDEAEKDVEAAISVSRHTFVVDTAARLTSEDPPDNPEYDRALAELCVDILPNLNQDEHKEAMIRVLRKRK